MVAHPQLVSLQWQSQLALTAAFLATGSEGREDSAGEVQYLLLQCSAAVVPHYIVRDARALLSAAESFRIATSSYM